jgi:hypothetical protein
VLPLPNFGASALRLRRRPAGVGEKGCGISAPLAGCNDCLFKSAQRPPGQSVPLGEEMTGDAMEHVSATAAIYESLLGTFANAHSSSTTMLLDRDYNWCAETMLKNYGLGAVGRAEHRAWEMLQEGNPDGYDIWTTVAATIRQIQGNAEAA